MRYEFPALVRYLRAFIPNNGYTPNSKVIIEPVTSGLSLLQTLKEETGFNVIASRHPSTDKIARVKDVSPVIEARRVHLFRHENWEPLLAECTLFPSARHDDLVDCLVMMIAYHTHTTQPPSVFSYGWT